MLQPFEPMKEMYLRRLVKLQRQFVVTQTYERGSSYSGDLKKVGLLFTDYSDVGLAKGHLSSLKNDKYGTIVDLTKPDHWQKIIGMLAENSGYHIFWAIVKSKKGLETQLTTHYKDHMRRWISRNTNWQIDRNDTIYPSLQLIYGDLFIILKYRGETKRFTFDELERT